VQSFAKELLAGLRVPADTRLHPNLRIKFWTGLTGQADLPHPALGQDFTPSPTDLPHPALGQDFTPLSTPASVRALRARTSNRAWARRAVGEGVKSCPRAGCGRSACPVRWEIRLSGSRPPNRNWARVNSEMSSQNIQPVASAGFGWWRRHIAPKIAAIPASAILPRSWHWARAAPPTVA
jgi:hypothetical protein